jgi:hypothetical protein
MGRSEKAACRPGTAALQAKGATIDRFRDCVHTGGFAGPEGWLAAAAYCFRVNLNSAGFELPELVHRSSW